MNRSQTIAQVARRLRRYTQDDVAEVINVLTEVWQEELLRPGGYIRLEGLGKLYVEQQDLHSSGVIQAHLKATRGTAPATLKRYYFRFRPTNAFRAALVEAAGQEEAE